MAIRMSSTTVRMMSIIEMAKNPPAAISITAALKKRAGTVFSVKLPFAAGDIPFGS